MYRCIHLYILHNFLRLADVIPYFIDRVKKHIEDFLDADFTKNATIKKEVAAKVKKFYFDGNNETEITNVIHVSKNKSKSNS